MGGGVSKKLMATRMVITVAQEVDTGDDINVADYISPGQAVAHSGLIWKLNLGADPKNLSEWRRRKMWLTDSGGLFYFSRQFGRPVGRSVAGLCVRVAKASEGPGHGRFVFEIQTTEDELLSVQPTLLATDGAADRDTWVRKLRAVIEAAHQRGNTGEVDPLEPMAGKIRTERVRLNCMSSTGNFMVPVPSASCPPIANSKSFGAALKTSLAVRLQHHSESTRVPGEVPQDLHHAPSFGPNAFLERPQRRLGTGRGQEGGGSPPAKVPARPPLVKRDSQDAFADKANTVLVLDWDDTIFPTTFIRQDCGLDWRIPLHKQVERGPGRDQLLQALNRHVEHVDEFMALATSLANVVVVTLAKRPWVATSAENFTPGLRTILDQYKVPVIYAREKLTKEMQEEYARDAFKDAKFEADFWMRAKAETMREHIAKVYGIGTSWKNLLSFGDSDFERLALVRTAEQYMQKERESGALMQTDLTYEAVTEEGHRRRLRAKTVKLLEEPALEEMVAQISILREWLPHLVRRDSGIDIVLEDSTDDARLIDIDLEVTGKRRETLTWRGLAGLEED